MKQRLLVSSIIMGLCASLTTNGALAQNADQSTSDSGKKRETTELKGVVVTGSLIPQAQIETASATLKITGAQLEKQGFANVYQALRSMPLATGAVQDGQSSGGGFTPGAQEISLLGLDPGFTLIMINGHPMADFPFLFNGSSNFVDLTNIPAGMVDHIDILPGNQSAVYGSSAIAGVVNIILKDRIDGFELNARVGSYSSGGGQNQRLEFLGGHTWGNLDLTFGLQLNNEKPIWGYNRDITKSTNSNPDPNGRYGQRDFLYINYGPNYGSGTYVDPGQATCSSLSNLWGGTTDYEYRQKLGYYCGSKYAAGYGTILNKNRSGTAYINLKYRLDDDTQAYANMLYSVGSVTFSSGAGTWATNNNNAFFNSNTGNFELFQHLFSPEEMGGLGPSLDTQLSRQYTAWAGIRGSFGKNWDYDLFYARSQDNVWEKSPWLLGAKADALFEQLFLGPKQGTQSGYPVYAPNVNNFYKPLTPAQYASINGTIRSKNVAWTQNLNLQVTNTDLFSLPAGSVGFAGVAQIGSQAWNNPNDPRVVAGDFWGLTGTSGSGTRSNWAYSGELRVPITSMLTANLSARYDQYKNNGASSDDRPTYKLGLEFRPTDAWLLRASYGTAFRAPDMAYVFGGKSGFYNYDVNDYYRCATDPSQSGLPIDQCKYAGLAVFAEHYGNRKLQSITAKSWGYGVVWSPNSDFDIKADYYNVNISNEVQLQSMNGLLQIEAACRTGQIDINSPTCVTTLAQITRNPPDSANPNALQQVIVLPINIAKEKVSGIIASLDYKLDLARYGSLAFAAQYNVTLEHRLQQYPGDPEIDMLRSPYYAFSEQSGPQFKTIANASVTWDIGPFSTTLFGTRYGKTPNYIAASNSTGYATPGSGSVAPWILYNGSINYSVNDDMRVSFIVNNIKNSMPPKDSSWTVYPYYNAGSYNPYGRQMWLEFDWKFGRSGS
ncbi:MAG: TonB-dependent receptor [Rudaea sp.]|nr:MULTISPECIES: TonB-dependent receptor [unclassified Rudaea]MBN8887275.1 TonB-dependent receptor [Rudaea sp.]